ncbi:MAG: hypothetical protein AVDCRST_MAG59-3648, partial [uncultured Thermomicrobiales bacterium]
AEPRVERLPLARGTLADAGRRSVPRLRRRVTAGRLLHLVRRPRRAHGDLRPRCARGDPGRDGACHRGAPRRARGRGGV